MMAYRKPGTCNSWELMVLAHRQKGLFSEQVLWTNRYYRMNKSERLKLDNTKL